MLEVFTRTSFLKKAQANSHDFVAILKTAIMNKKKLTKIYQAYLLMKIISVKIVTTHISEKL